MKLRTAAVKDGTFVYHRCGIYSGIVERCEHDIDCPWYGACPWTYKRLEEKTLPCQ